MKLIRIFQSLLLFAVAAFAFLTVSAQHTKHLIVPIPVKAERIVRQIPTKATPANFVRTDCLVMYEITGANSPAAASYQFQIVESFSVKSFAVSKFFRTQPDYYRRLHFILS